MESKLPKPSGIKRPGAIPKAILPTDRIKPSAFGFGSKAGNGLLGNTTLSGVSSHAPLSRDVLNLPTGSSRGRAGSPETTQFTFNQRAKLRRSKSACDIRDFRSLKRTDNAINKLASIPAKSTRFGSTLNVATSANTHASNTNKPDRIGNGALKRLGTATTQRPVINRNITNINPAKKPTTTTSSSSTNPVPAKPTAKKIPPYDFKARFHDLLEKHRSLKEKYEEKCDQFGNLENLPDQLEETKNELIKTTKELENVKKEAECLQKQVKSQGSKIDLLTNSLTSAKTELESLRTAHEAILAENSKLTVEVNELRKVKSELTEKNTELQMEVDISKERLFEFNMERKELHNKIMDLRGNIRVFCRVRPPLEIEQDKALCGWNYLDESTVEIQNLGGSIGSSKQNSHVFNFDQVFHPYTTQEEIFEMVSPLIQSAMDGYNVCIFAYGQTGSGKTYTMDGIPTNAGVIPRTVDLLFDSIKNYKRLGWEYEIKVTFLEIYNEVLYDLLSNEQKEMEIRMAKHNKNEIYVSNITEEVVTSANHLRELMQVAKMNRATACTAGNERSSRSHAVTKIELTGQHQEKQEISVGTINLVDLAGSESPKTSMRMTETKNINRSLSELTNVILALLQKQDHIPYRNSKLTHLLMPSLGGNSKTLMFINVAPFQDCFVESVKSLRFAASVNSCKVKAKRNRILNTSICGSGSFDK